MYELHRAASDGSVERTVAALSTGVVDIDDVSSTRGTPLMIAAHAGYSRVVRILLKEGANVAVQNNEGANALHYSAAEGHLAVTKLLVNNGANVATTMNNGATALHYSAREGHLAVTQLLVKAGADLEAKASTEQPRTPPRDDSRAAPPVVGAAPLHLAAELGRSEVVRVLIEAGVNPNSRRSDGATPLFCAACDGHVDAVTVLLRAKANPLLTYTDPSGGTWIPLDGAAQSGHVKVARELIQQLGIEERGGASGGVCALRCAAQNQDVKFMDVLASGGVVDCGRALWAAAAGHESSVRFLLQQPEQRAGGEGAGYLETCDPSGGTPMLRSIWTYCPRVTRMLVDAGADTTTAVRLKDAEGRVVFNDTPLAYAERLYDAVGREGATESQLHDMEAIRRLLLRVEAVHAVSWLWASEATTYAAAEATGRAVKAPPTPLIVMLPILKRRAGRPRRLLTALFRWVVCGIYLGGEAAAAIRSGEGRAVLYCLVQCGSHVLRN